MVSRIYQHTRVDVYQLGPLYAFSALSARTAVGLAIVMYLPAYISRGFESYAIWTIVRIFVAAIVALTFLWPLLGIHSLLAKEKHRMLGENARQLKTTYRELHQSIENSEPAGIESTAKAIGGLESEQKTLRAVSTWPWQPETPRAVVAAILIPVVIWLIQWVLQRVLGT